MRLRKQGGLDKRFRLSKTIKAVRNYCQEYRGALWAVILLGLVAGTVLSVSFYRARHPSLTSPEAPETNLDVGGNQPGVKKLVSSVEAHERSFCYDPIACIRDVGEELGVGNQDIMTMIRIAKAESGLRPRAKNPSSSASGLFQIIAGTWYSNDCVGDKWNFEDNTRCAYKLYQRRGFQPWNASKHVWNR